MIVTEFISRSYGQEEFDVIIKTDSKEHYKAAEDFARKLIDHAKPQTNGDRIRAMSDEELAEWLNSFGGDLFCLNKKECVELVDADRDIPAERCQRCVMDWLQQPAAGGS